MGSVIVDDTEVEKSVDQVGDWGLEDWGCQVDATEDFQYVWG